MIRGERTRLSLPCETDWLVESLARSEAHGLRAETEQGWRKEIYMTVTGSPRMRWVSLVGLFMLLASVTPVGVAAQLGLTP